MNYQIGGISAGIAGCGQDVKFSPPPAACSQIEQRLQELESTNKAMNELISGLQVKLQTVLIPQMVSDAKGAATPKPVVSPLADRLDAYLGEHRHLLGILRDLYDRLAL